MASSTRLRVWSSASRITSATTPTRLLVSATSAMLSSSLTTWSLWATTSIWSKPAASRMVLTLSGSASENGPGSPGPGRGGGVPVTDIAAAQGMSIHSLSKTLCQQTNDSRPPGSSPRLTLVKAATGSAKNMTPKRE